MHVPKYQAFSSYDTIPIYTPSKKPKGKELEKKRTRVNHLLSLKITNSSNSLDPNNFPTKTFNGTATPATFWL